MPLVRRPALLTVYAAIFVFLAASYFLAYPLPGFLTRVREAATAAGLLVLLAAAGRAILRAAAPRPFFDALSSVERWLFGLGLGAVPFALGLLALGAAGRFKASAFLVLTAGFGALGLHEFRRLRRERRSASASSSAAVPAVLWFSWPVGVLALLCAFAPPTYYDSLVYHLALPAKYLQEGRVGFVPFNHYSHFPQNMEMIFGWFLALGSDTAAQVFNLGLAIATGWGLWSFWPLGPGKRAFRYDFLLWLTAPCLLLLSSETYVEVPLAFWTLLALRAAMHAVERGERFGWALSGVLGGFAAGVKYTGALTPILLAIGALLWPRPRSAADRSKDALALAAASLGVFAPWLVKNYVLTGGNPVFPFLPSVFPADQVHLFRESAQAYFQVLDEYKGTSGLLIDLFKMPFTLTTDATRFGGGFDVTGDLGWALPLLLLPLGLLARRAFPAAGFLAAYLAAHLLLWASLRPVLRFLFPVFPLVCLLAGRGLAEALAPAGRWARRTAHAVLALFILSNAVLFYWVERVRDPFPVAFGLLSREEYLSKKLDYYPWMALMGEALEPTARVLFVGEQRAYYCPRPYLAPMALLPPPLRDWAEEAPTADALRRKLRSLGFTHLFFNRREAERIKNYRVLDLTPAGRAAFDDMLASLPVVGAADSAALYRLDPA